jgi:hypothetical protein
MAELTVINPIGSVDPQTGKKIYALGIKFHAEGDPEFSQNIFVPTVQLDENDNKVLDENGQEIPLTEAEQLAFMQSYADAYENEWKASNQLS